MLKRTLLLLLGCLMLTGCVVGIARDREGRPVTFAFPAWASDTLSSSLELSGTVAFLPPVFPTDTLAPTPTPTPPVWPTSTPLPGPQPAIVYFSVSPAEVDPGQSATLAWRAIGQEAYIITLDPFGRLTNDAVRVPLSGTLTISTSVYHYNQVMYLLSVVSGSARVAQGVSLKLTCLHDWFFAAAPDVCPREAATPGPGAEQHFEGGTMVWVGEWDSIFVLYNDTSVGAWSLFTDHWNEGEPESDPDIVPPAGFYQPIRGFGKVWRENPQVRERLGYAVDREQGYSIQAQRTSYPKYNSFYLLALDGNVWHMGPEGSSWEKIPLDAPPAAVPADTP